MVINIKGIKYMTEMIKSIINGEFEIMLPEHRAARPDWYQDHGWEDRKSVV